MKRIKPYPQEKREEIIKDYLQSGLSTYTFCRKANVEVSCSTLNRWVNIYLAGAKSTQTSGFTGIPENLGMVCYTVAESDPKGDDQPPAETRRLSLEQMVLFHKLVYECCCSLQGLACTAENAKKVDHILGVL